MSEKENNCCLSSCCSSSCCSNEGKEEKNCPVCGGKALSVLPITAKSLIKKSRKISLKENFYICLNPDCKISYFTDSKTYKTSDTVVPIDFKSDSKIKYACYCNKLTYEEVAFAVKNKKAKNWAEVVKVVKGKINPSKCIEKNPFGSCCTSNSFKRAMDEARKIGGRK